MNCEVLDFVAEATDAALFVEARIRQDTGLGGAGIDEGRHHRPRFHARFIHTSGVVLVHTEGFFQRVQWTARRTSIRCRKRR